MRRTVLWIALVLSVLTVLFLVFPAIARMRANPKTYNCVDVTVDEMRAARALHIPYQIMAGYNDDDNPGHVWIEFQLPFHKRVSLDWGLPANPAKQYTHVSRMSDDILWIQWFNRHPGATRQPLPAPLQ